MSSSTDRAAYTILADDVTATAEFYTRLAPFERRFSSDSYVVLQSDADPVIELAIIDSRANVLPFETLGRPAAGFLSLVVADLDEVVQRAREIGVVAARRRGFFGSSRLQFRDPNGVVLELCTAGAVPLSATA